MNNDQRSATTRRTYCELVGERKACARCQGLTNPSRCEDGKFDGDEVGAWSCWQGNLTAELMVVGQDWGDVNYFVKNRGREARGNPTNDNLIKLLGSIGFLIDEPSIVQTSMRGLLFFTNAILCLKDGGLQGPVKKDWFETCGQYFLRPTITIIKPPVIVTLGEQAFRALELVYSLPRKPKRSFKSVVEDQDGIPLPDGPHLFPMYHCGSGSVNRNRDMELQMQDWMRVRAWIDRGKQK